MKGDRFYQKVKKKQVLLLFLQRNEGFVEIDVILPCFAAERLRCRVK